MQQGVTGRGHTRQTSGHHHGNGRNGRSEAMRHLPANISQQTGLSLAQRSVVTAHLGKQLSVPDLPPSTEWIDALQKQYGVVDAGLNISSTATPGWILDNAASFFKSCHQALEYTDVNILATVALLSDQLAESITQCPQTLTAEPEMKKAILGWVSFGQGLSALLRGEHADAWSKMEIAIRGGVSEAWYWMGLLYLGEGEEQEAIKCLKTACDNGVSSAMNRLGLLLYDDLKAWLLRLGGGNGDEELVLTAGEQQVMISKALDALHYGEPSLMTIVGSCMATGVFSFPNNVDYGLFLLDQAASMNSPDAHLVKFLFYLQPNAHEDVRAEKSQPLEALDSLMAFRTTVERGISTRQRYEWIEQFVLDTESKPEWPEAINIRENCQKARKAKNKLAITLMNAIGLTETEAQDKAIRTLWHTPHPEYLFWSAALMAYGLIEGGLEMARLQALLSANRNWPPAGTLLARLWDKDTENEGRLGLAAPRFSHEESCIYNTLSSAWFDNRYGDHLSAYALLMDADKKYRDLDITYQCELTLRNILPDSKPFSERLLKHHHNAQLSSIRSGLAQGKKGSELRKVNKDINSLEGLLMFLAGESQFLTDGPKPLPWCHAMQNMTPRHSYRLFELVENDLLQIEPAEKARAFEQMVEGLDEKTCFELQQDSGRPAVEKALRTKLADCREPKLKKRYQQLLLWLTGSCQDTLAYADVLVKEGSINSAFEVLYSGQCRLHARRIARCFINDLENQAIEDDWQVGITAENQPFINELTAQIDRLGKRAAQLREQVEDKGQQPMLSFYEHIDQGAMTRQALAGLGFDLPENKSQAQQALKALRPLVPLLLYKAEDDSPERLTLPFTDKSWTFERCLHVLGTACHLLESQSEASEYLHFAAMRGYEPAMFLAGQYAYFTNRFDSAGCWFSSSVSEHKEAQIWHEDTMYYQVLKSACFPGDDGDIDTAFHNTVHRARELALYGQGCGFGVLMGRLLGHGLASGNKMEAKYQDELTRCHNGAMAMGTFRALEPLLHAMSQGRGQHLLAIDPLAVANLVMQSRLPVFKVNELDLFPMIEKETPICRMKGELPVDALTRYLRYAFFMPRDEQMLFLEVIMNIHKGQMKCTRLEGASEPDMDMLSMATFLVGCARGNHAQCQPVVSSLAALPVSIRLLAAQAQVYRQVNLELPSSQVKRWLDEAARAGFAAAWTCRGVNALLEDQPELAERFLIRGAGESQNGVVDPQACYILAQCLLKKGLMADALVQLYKASCMYHMPSIYLLLQVNPQESHLKRLGYNDSIGWMNSLPHFRLVAMLTEYQVIEDSKEKEALLKKTRSLLSQGTAAMYFDVLVFLVDNPDACSSIKVGMLANGLQKNMGRQEAILLSLHHKKEEVLALLKEKRVGEFLELRGKLSPAAVPVIKVVSLPEKKEPSGRLAQKPTLPSYDEVVKESKRKTKRKKVPTVTPADNTAEQNSIKTTSPPKSRVSSGPDYTVLNDTKVLYYLGRAGDTDKAQAELEARREDGRLLRATLGEVCEEMVHHYNGSLSSQCLWLKEACGSNGATLLLKTIKKALECPEDHQADLAAYTQLLIEFLSGEQGKTLASHLNELFGQLKDHLSTELFLRLGQASLALAYKLSPCEKLELLANLLRTFDHEQIQESGLALLLTTMDQDGMTSTVLPVLGNTTRLELFEYLLKPKIIDLPRSASALKLARCLLTTKPAKVLQCLQSKTFPDRMAEEVAGIKDECRIARERLKTDESLALDDLQADFHLAVQSGSYSRQRLLLHERLAVWMEKGGQRASELLAAMLDADTQQELNDTVRTVMGLLEAKQLTQRSAAELKEWHTIIDNAEELDQRSPSLIIALQVALLAKKKTLPIGEVNRLLARLRGLEDSALLAPLQPEIRRMFRCSLDKLLERVRQGKDEWDNKRYKCFIRLLEVWERFGLTESEKSGFYEQLPTVVKLPDEDNEWEAAQLTDPEPAPNPSDGKLTDSVWEGEFFEIKAPLSSPSAVVLSQPDNESSGSGASPVISQETSSYSPLSSHSSEQIKSSEPVDDSETISSPEPARGPDTVSTRESDRGFDRELDKSREASEPLDEIPDVQLFADCHPDVFGNYPLAVKAYQSFLNECSYPFAQFNPELCEGHLIRMNYYDPCLEPMKSQVMRFHYRAMRWYLDYGRDFDAAFRCLKLVLQDVDGDLSRLGKTGLQGVEDAAKRLFARLGEEEQDDAQKEQWLKDIQGTAELWQKVIKLEAEQNAPQFFDPSVKTRSEILEWQLATCASVQVLKEQINTGPASQPLLKKLDKLLAQTERQVDRFGKGRRKLMICRDLANGVYDDQRVKATFKASEVMAGQDFFECKDIFAPYAEALLQRLPHNWTFPDCPKAGVFNLDVNRIYLLLTVMLGELKAGNLDSFKAHLEQFSQESTQVNRFPSKNNGLFLSLCLDIKNQAKSQANAEDFTQLTEQLDKAQSNIMQTIMY
ncbi:hypothetical protein [Parendozoicomonas haliclonae]|uniref:Uncharacterized protein n=1 Tax=Parendozoicomonas haliclonae TaxID=1960125 RepID=A0A1X7AK14_9GAMM|nr:hypothetical protein [Parendozoicomonas haliclonae]SMA42836.1 hypothetical protein EHSB41UT_01494 [Parendozoicomonas haliclonae]